MPAAPGKIFNIFFWQKQKPEGSKVYNTTEVID
jgi:hypothetical protein